jgi:murein DD-endopeptidase MepM/ murein hydrolase activator NlpD
MPQLEVVTIYGHLKKAEWADFDWRKKLIQIRRGQKIGETGKSGTGWTHLHLTVGLVESGVGFRVKDPFGVTYPSEDPMVTLNLWTRFNQPQCPS